MHTACTHTPNGGTVHNHLHEQTPSRTRSACSHPPATRPRRAQAAPAAPAPQAPAAPACASQPARAASTNCPRARHRAPLRQKFVTPIARVRLAALAASIARHCARTGSRRSCRGCSRCALGDDGRRQPGGKAIMPGGCTGARKAIIAHAVLILVVGGSVNVSGLQRWLPRLRWQRQCHCPATFQRRSSPRAALDRRARCGPQPAISKHARQARTAAGLSALVRVSGPTRPKVAGPALRSGQRRCHLKKYDWGRPNLASFLLHIHIHIHIHFAQRGGRTPPGNRAVVTDRTCIFSF